MTKSEFTAYLEPFVTQAIQDTGTTIKPSVIIARALIESGSKNGFGVSQLQTDANNFFGFTANKNYSGEKQLFKTWESVSIPTYGEEKFLGKNQKGAYEYLRYFRKYNSPLESIKDFIHLVSTSPKFSQALQADTAKAQAQIIARGGYATSPYSESLFVTLVNESENLLSKLGTLAKEHTTGIAVSITTLFTVGILIYFLTRN